MGTARIIGMGERSDAPLIQMGNERRPYPVFRWDAREERDYELLAQAWRQGREIAEKVIDYRQALEASGVYTDEGVSRRMHDHMVVDVMKPLRDLRKELVAGLVEKAAKWRKVLEAEAYAITPGDSADELRRQEIRAAVRAMNSKDRLFFLRRDAPLEVRAAIAAAPAFLSGATPELHELMRRAVLEERGGAELAELEELEEAIQAATTALERSEEAAWANSGLPRPKEEPALEAATS